jgi:hypothetical protein
MDIQAAEQHVQGALHEAGIEAGSPLERMFPGERWLIFEVAPDSLAVAQSLSGTLEARLNDGLGKDEPAFVVMFRPGQLDSERGEEPRGAGRLRAAGVDQLIQLLEARSRTSDALPSLRYMEDPRASLSAVGASRHQFVYGRRGVGKTALLLEAKRRAESRGALTVWVNAHVLRDLPPAQAACVVASMVLGTLGGHAGTTGSTYIQSMHSLVAEIDALRKNSGTAEHAVNALVPDVNQAVRRVLGGDLQTLFVYIDDFYLVKSDAQAIFLDLIAAMLRDSDAWIKLASIERLTRPYEPSTQRGLEIPHDASRMDLDVTLEDPRAAQQFLESVLVNYTETAGISSVRSIAKSEALGRLVLASGGVPRDYLNLFASSLVVAREARQDAREVGREDVAIAAGRSARTKKRDLELDVSSGRATELLVALEKLSEFVKGSGYAYFRVDVGQKDSPEYELLSLLVDLRFAHLVQASLSDQHKSGVRYEAYVLDLSEFADVRLKRGLNLLDLESGRWVHRLTGQAKSAQGLSTEQLREKLRRSPVVPMGVLSGA